MRKIECICKLNDGRIVRARYEKNCAGEWFLWSLFDGEWRRVYGPLNDADVHEAIERLKANGDVAWYTVIRCAA